MSGSTSRRYPAELRERAVRMVGEIRADHESDWAAMSQVAELLGLTVAALALAAAAVRLDDVVRIPMAGGVDSLNVAAASAVAFWATRPGVIDRTTVG